MLHPSYTDLINAVNSDVEPGEQPVVQSRYSIVIATAKRARQLIDGEEALVPDHGKKALSVAIEELHKGRVKVVAEDTQEEETIPSSLDDNTGLRLSEEDESEEGEDSEDSEDGGEASDEGAQEEE